MTASGISFKEDKHIFNLSITTGLQSIQACKDSKIQTIYLKWVNYIANDISP